MARFFLMAACLGLVVLVGGCDSGEKIPELAVVTGEVKVDGKPAEGLTVKFEPKDGGAASYGETDEDGKYTLKHNSGKDGAVVGSHVVRITVANEAEATITLPAKYGIESTMTATVEAGKENEIPVFELTSK